MTKLGFAYKIEEGRLNEPSHMTLMKAYVANARAKNFGRDTLRLRDSHQKQMTAIIQLDVIPGLDKSIDYKLPERFISEAEFDVTTLSLVV